VNYSVAVNDKLNYLLKVIADALQGMGQALMAVFALAESLRICSGTLASIVDIKGCPLGNPLGEMLSLFWKIMLIVQAPYLS